MSPRSATVWAGNPGRILAGARPGDCDGGSEHMPAVVESLYYQHGGWLSVVAANDERPLNGHFALYYVLSVEGNEEEQARRTREMLYGSPFTGPAAPAGISAVSPPHVPAAIWYEREMRDMFGIQPVGLPDERRLVLPDDWPEDLYPLRKDTMDYRYRPEPTTEKETYEFIDVEGEGIVRSPAGTAAHDIG